MSSSPKISGITSLIVQQASFSSAAPQLLLKKEKEKNPKLDKTSGNSRLPPPNMSYLTRRPRFPLKWTPPNSCSGFILSDNSVVFVGTGRYTKEALQKSFLDFMSGKDDEDTDSTDSDHQMEDSHTSTAIQEDATAVVTSSSGSDSHIESIPDTRISDELLGLEVLQDPQTLREFSQDDISPPLKVVSKSKNVQEMEVGTSSSSDDADLPEVDVTAGKRRDPSSFSEENLTGGNMLVTEQCPVCSTIFPRG